MYCCYNIKNIKPAITFFVFYAEKLFYPHEIEGSVECINLNWYTADRYLIFLHRCITFFDLYHSFRERNAQSKKNLKNVIPGPPLSFFYYTKKRDHHINVYEQLVRLTVMVMRLSIHLNEFQHFTRLYFTINCTFPRTLARSWCRYIVIS